MIQAIEDRLIVEKVNPKPEKKKDSVIISLEEKKYFHVGKIISSGPKVDVIEGQFVWMHKNAGMSIEYKGKEYISLKLEEILAVSEDLE